MGGVGVREVVLPVNVLFSVGVRGGRELLSLTSPDGGNLFGSQRGL